MDGWMDDFGERHFVEMQEFFNRLSTLPRTKPFLLTNELFTHLSPLHPKLTPLPAKEKVVVDFSSVNIAKPIHAGHLRATLLGNFIVRINEALGNNVVGINYLGDWGTQFGYLSHGFNLFGQDAMFAKDPINHMYDVYVRANALVDSNDDNSHKEAIRAFTQRLEAGGVDELKQWHTFKQASLTHLEDTYKRMGISFTKFEFESDFVQSGKAIVGELLRRGLAYRNGEGLVLSHIGDQQVVLLKSDGSSLYLTRDIAAAVHRYEENQFDRIHYVVENGQTLHFQHLKSLLGLLDHPIRWKIVDYPQDKFHVKFGRISGMSTRRGNVVFLNDIFDEAQLRCMEAMQKSPNTQVNSDDFSLVADKLGFSIVAMTVLGKSRQKPIAFTWTHDHAAIHIQYCHARLCRLEECALQSIGISDPHAWPEVNSTLLNQLILNEPAFTELIDCMMIYPEVLLRSYESYEPNIIVNYVIQLNSLLNNAIHRIRVIDSTASTEQIQARLLPFSAGRMVLSCCMHLLGIEALPKM